MDMSHATLWFKQSITEYRKTDQECYWLALGMTLQLPSSDCPDDAIEAEILPDKNGQMAPHLDELLGDLVDEDYERLQKCNDKYLNSPQSKVQKQLRSKNGKLIFRKGSKLTQQEYSSQTANCRDDRSSGVAKG